MDITPRAVLCGVLLAVLAGPLCATAQATAASTPMDSGVIKLADSNIEYFSQGQGEAVVLLPGGSLTVGARAYRTLKLIGLFVRP